MKTSEPGAKTRPWYEEIIIICVTRRLDCSRCSRVSPANPRRNTGERAWGRDVPIHSVAPPADRHVILQPRCIQDYPNRPTGPKNIQIFVVQTEFLIRFCSLHGHEPLENVYLIIHCRSDINIFLCIMLLLYQISKFRITTCFTFCTIKIASL